ncbi:tetratricopeptide repeat protein [Colidextribacter sp. OB.20]|uniref:tetratricopeptide repeat protein n=1 Tax=Colidextribacter sp. OB.20 TaxID=2304568 RepID=UPI00136D7787|nr:tetratricopeptide repeat protein [Colidextribacter sp. OB.20]NBI10912.1 tetratricopeptide repeat protein [Colidextribacter sp. OB.20]
MEESNNNILFNFFLLGCEWAILCRNNILYYDIHGSNILLKANGDFAVVDMDDVEIFEFPKEIEKYANGLINLYTNFGMEFGAAFRYGFINVAGDVGCVLYDILYNKNELTTFNSTIRKRKVDINVESLTKIYAKWNALIDESFVKKVTNGKYKYGEFSFIELMERNSDAYNNFKEAHKDDRDLLKHEYQVYFANGLFSENDFDIVASALTLCQIEFLEQQYFLASYYFCVARERITNNEDCLMSLKEDISCAIYRFISKFGQDGTRRLLAYVFHESFRLRLQRSIINHFYEIWYWSDFAREHSIEDFIEERKYGCYKCHDCNNVDFFDEAIVECRSCGSKNIEQISLEEYISLKVASLISQNNDISKEVSVDHTNPKEKLPELNSVALIPLYIQKINTSERKNKYADAIELAICIEKFLHSNPNICDDKGYVIEKARTGGQIFYSTITPNEVAKLFLDGAENVKNDYESYICYKLCVLYEKENNRAAALEYARRIIELANCSPRWLQNGYIECAYELLKNHYDDMGNKKEALIYSNIIFTYSMLTKIDDEFSNDTNSSEIRDTITILMDIGKSNASVGNISLAYSCYILALRIHIYYHGSRDPETATIYHNIAQLFAAKKLYEDAYNFWSVSLMLLEGSKIERYAEQISEIETSVLNVLSESTSHVTLSEWKKEWMAERAFNVFPEKRFERKTSPDNEMPKREISMEELLKEYVVYNA